MEEVFAYQIGPGKAWELYELYSKKQSYYPCSTSLIASATVYLFFNCKNTKNQKSSKNRELFIMAMVSGGHRVDAGDWGP